MGEPEIKTKLANFIDRHCPFDEEAQVVYFFVEIRKVLDRRRPNEAFPILRFYADWCVHIEKTKRGDVLIDIVDKMYLAAAAYVRNNTDETVKGLVAIAEFAGMEALRKEVCIVLASLDLDPGKVCGNKSWAEFVKLLTSVLGDQPFKNPSPDISAIQFISGTKHCVIQFRKPVAGETSFSFELN